MGDDVVWLIYALCFVACKKMMQKWFRYSCKLGDNKRQAMHMKSGKHSRAADIPELECSAQTKI